jgi:hypothetical protein
VTLPEVGARTVVYGASAPAEARGELLPDCKIAKGADETLLRERV